MQNYLSLSDLWSRVRRRQQSLSAGFDTAIDRLLASLLTLLSASPLRRYSFAEAMMQRLTLSQTEEALAAEIVTQPDTASTTDVPVTVSPRFTQAVSRTARVAMVLIALTLLWWTWPSPEGSAAQSTADATPTATEQAPLAIVNPENMRAATATPLPNNEPAQENAAQPALVSMPGLAGDGKPVSATEAVTATEDLIQATSSNSVDVADVASEPKLVVIAAAPRGRVEAFLIPTPAGSPTPTPDVPFVNVITAPGFVLPDGMETATPTPSPTPSPTPIALTAGRLWSNFTPKSPTENTHFWIERPFTGAIENKIASPNYQFGSTAGGRYRIHHGMDISSPSGTPVRSAVEGEVIHAGWDDPDVLGPYGGFYGNSVVIRLDRKLPVAGGELDVYLLYGHLSEVTTTVGTHVGVDDFVGRVGMTGIAIGPHLHVEVRIGTNSYEQSVNPYLWVKPVNNAGAVAVRLLSADGRTWPGAYLSLALFQGSKAVWARQIEIYRGAENIAPDPAWGENGAMGSVPPGHYYLIGSVNGESIRTEIDVVAGETTFVELRTEQ